MFLFFFVSPHSPPLPPAENSWRPLIHITLYYTLYVRAAAKRCVSRYEPDASTKTRKDKRNEIIIVVSPAVTSAGGDNGHNAVCSAASPDYAARIPILYIRRHLTRLVSWKHTYTHIYHINIIISSVARTHTKYKHDTTHVYYIYILCVEVPTYLRGI